MSEESLEMLNLTAWETRTYLALIKLGKSGSSEIAREANVPYGRIYDVLNSLINKQLAFLIPEKTKKFIPGNPDVLQRILLKKEQETEKVKKQLEIIKAQFQEQKEVDHDKVVVVKGKRNFYKTINELPWARTYSFEVKTTAEYRADFIEATKTNLKKGVTVKQLIDENPQAKENIKKWKKHFPKVEIKPFKCNNISMNITDDYFWIALIDSNTLVLIKDKNVVKVMKQMYESTFKNITE